MTATQQVAWPEGVIARYLTLGGATVDLTYDDAKAPSVRVHQGTAWESTISMITIAVTARCDGEGCRQATTAKKDIKIPWGGRPLETNPGIAATQWAQKHAEKCRAMPHPAG